MNFFRGDWVQRTGMMTRVLNYVSLQPATAVFPKLGTRSAAPFTGVSPVTCPYHGFVLPLPYFSLFLSTPPNTLWLSTAA